MLGKELSPKSQGFPQALGLGLHQKGVRLSCGIILDSGWSTISQTGRDEWFSVTKTTGELLQSFLFFTGELSI